VAGFDGSVVLQQVILLAMAVTFSEEFKRESFIKDFARKHKYAVLVMAIKCLPVWIFSNFNILIFYLCSIYFKIPAPENVANFFLLTAVFIVAATNLGVLVSIIIPDALKATQILMVIITGVYYQWIYVADLCNAFIYRQFYQYHSANALFRGFEDNGCRERIRLSDL
jgi:ABC-type multidrug transport system permease subunit